MRVRLAEPSRRSFVVKMRDAGYPRNIVAMIVSLAHTLGLKVIAEGVEDDEQVRLLRDLGCDQIQGYLVSRPVPAEEVAKLLSPAPPASVFDAKVESIRRAHS